MEKNKTKIISIASLLALVILIIGATYAYFVAQTGEGSQTDIRINAGTVDTLTFETGDPITLTLDQENFAEGKGNQTGSTFAKAMLTANNKTNTATEHYYMYLNISDNTFTYTQDEDTPEILLTITDTNNNEITSINGLSYKTVTDGNGTTLKGFDITTQNDLIAIFENREITTTSSITEEWNVTVTYVNYNFDQSANAGKSFSAKLMIQKKEYVLPDIRVKVADAQTTYGKLGNVNCNNSNATYNQQYNRIEISSVNKENTKCNLDYTDSTSKVNLADYIIGLSGTTQGTGQVVNESTTVDNSTFTAGDKLDQSDYTISSNDATYPFEWDDTNKTWTSTNHTDSATATFEFKVASDGYHQLCYKQSSEQNYDYTIFYKDNIQIKSLKGIANNDFECYYLGNLTTSNVIKVTYRKDSSNSSGDDNIVFYLQDGTHNENIQTVSAGFRYEGKNPNNYIWFNNEYWRIIGVFDSASHGQEGKNLVKIIRKNVLDGLAWYESGYNDWSSASLNLLLNGAYYNAQDGTNSGYCYGGNSVPSNCDYTIRGIQSSYRG